MAKYNVKDLRNRDVFYRPSGIPVRPLNHTVDGIFYRLKLAWLVLIGKYDALDWQEHLYDEAARNDEKTLKVEECKLPPRGWTCSRGAGHPGPCNARGQKTSDKITYSRSEDGSKTVNFEGFEAVNFAAGIADCMGPVRHPLENGPTTSWTVEAHAHRGKFEHTCRCLESLLRNQFGWILQLNYEDVKSINARAFTYPPGILFTFEFKDPNEPDYNINIHS